MNLICTWFWPEQVGTLSWALFSVFRPSCRPLLTSLEVWGLGLPPQWPCSEWLGPAVSHFGQRNRYRCVPEPRQTSLCRVLGQLLHSVLAWNPRIIPLAEQWVSGFAGVGQAGQGAVLGLQRVWGALEMLEPQNALLPRTVSGRAQLSL